MLKFEAKREILQKFGKNWGAYSHPAPLPMEDGQESQ